MKNLHLPQWLTFLLCASVSALTYCGELTLINHSNSCVRAYFIYQGKPVHTDIKNHDKAIITPLGSEKLNLSFSQFHSFKKCGGEGIYFFKANSGKPWESYKITVDVNSVTYG